MCFIVPVSVVVLFFVSWAPFHIQRLGYVYFKNFEMFRTVNQILFYFSGCFYYLSSTLNPLLYNVMSIKYRQSWRQDQFLPIVKLSYQFPYQRIVCMLKIRHGIESFHRSNHFPFAVFWSIRCYKFWKKKFRKKLKEARNAFYSVFKTCILLWFAFVFKVSGYFYKQLLLQNDSS